MASPFLFTKGTQIRSLTFFQSDRAVLLGRTSIVKFCHAKELKESQASSTIKYFPTGVFLEGVTTNFRVKGLNSMKSGNFNLTISTAESETAVPSGSIGFYKVKEIFFESCTTQRSYCLGKKRGGSLNTSRSKFTSKKPHSLNTLVLI